MMDLKTIIAQLGQLEENRKVAGKAYGGSAQKDDDKEENHKRGAPEKKDMDASNGSDIQDMIGKKPSKEIGKLSVSHKLKEFIEQVETEKKQLDEVALDQSQVAIPSIGATTQPSSTSRPAGNAAVGMKVLDFKKPNDPLKAALDQAVKNKEVTALGEENLEEVAPPGMEDWIKGRKEAFKKQYGNRWEGVLYATAWDEYNKKHKKDESMYENKLDDIESKLNQRYNTQAKLDAYHADDLAAIALRTKEREQNSQRDQKSRDDYADYINREYYQQGQQGQQGRQDDPIYSQYMQQIRNHNQDKHELELEIKKLRHQFDMDQDSKTMDILRNRLDRYNRLSQNPEWQSAMAQQVGKESMYESADADKQPIMEGKLQEILEAYPHEHKMCQEGWAMDEGFYEALCDHYYKEGRIPRKIWHGPLEELRKCVEGCYMEDMGMVSEERKEYDLPPSMRPPATLDTVDVSRTIDLVPQQQANRELNKQLYMEPSMKKSAFETSEQGVAEGLNEFALGGGDSGDDGSIDETLKQLAAQWYNGDEDPRVEKILMAAGWEIGQDENYDDEPGVFVVQSGDEHGSSYMSWPAHELRQGVAEGQAPTYNVINVQSGKSVGTFRDGVGFMPGSNAKAAGMKPSPTVPNGHKIDYKSIVSEREFAFESWDSQLQSLLQEGLTVTTSTGGPMGQEDSVSVSASGEDAKAMMELLRNAGIGHGGADDSHDMGPEVADQDEVLGQLGGQEHDDSGDTDLSFLKKMIGTPVDADCGCDEGQTQTANPGNAQMSPMANKMDEAEVEEGNLFTKGLEDDNVKIGQKIIDESDDLGPVKDTSGRCMMVHKTSGKEIVVRDEPDVIKKYEAMGYQIQVGESDELGPVKDTSGRCMMVHKTSGKEIVVRDEPDVIAKYEAMGFKKQVEEADDEDHKDHTEKSSTGGRIERKDGVTKHHAGKHYGGSESDDDDEDIKEDSYDADDPTDVAGEKDERSEAIRDAGLAASYVPEEALDQPATFEGKSCMECGSPMEESSHECNECGYMESMHEEGYTFEGLFKKLAMIAEESTTEKDDKAEKAGKKVTKDIEYDEGHKGKDDDKAEKAGEKVTKDIEYDDKHDYYFGKDKDSSSRVRDTATGHKAEKTDKGTKYTKKHDDKLDEWANSPQNKLSDEEFQTEMNYMLQALSGGLNGPKVDNTTLPKTQVRPVAESESLDGWLRLAGIK